MADEGGHDDPSLRTLAVLQDESASETQRFAAFESMLVMKSGWWGPGQLYAFAAACALATARVLARERNLSPDGIDAESIASEALLALYDSAPDIHSSPRSWLKQVIRNKVLDDIRRHYHELSASPLRESQTTRVPVEESEEHPHGTSQDARAGGIHQRVLTAIERLTPALREVGRLLFVEQLSRAEIERSLGISPATLRQRIHRLQEALRSVLTERTP